MAGRHPKGLKPRDESAHPILKDAMEKGHLENGEEYVVPGFPDEESALKGKRSVYNAARHHNVSTSCNFRESKDGGFEVHFKIFSKNQARSYITKKAGGDPNNLAYNPFAKKVKQRNDDGGYDV